MRGHQRPIVASVPVRRLFGRLKMDDCYAVRITAALHLSVLQVTTYFTFRFLSALNICVFMLTANTRCG